MVYGLWIGASSSWMVVKIVDEHSWCVAIKPEQLQWPLCITKCLRLSTYKWLLIISFRLHIYIYSCWSATYSTSHYHCSVDRLLFLYVIASSWSQHSIISYSRTKEPIRLKGNNCIVTTDIFLVFRVVVKPRKPIFWTSRFLVFLNLTNLSFKIYSHSAGVQTP